MRSQTPVDYKMLSEHLQSAWRKNTGVKPVTVLAPELTVEDAYQIQLAQVQRFLDEGQVITGKKIGLTSKAMQVQLGVNEPDYGHLFNNMLVRHQGKVKQSELLQPKVEAEIAFKLKKTLKGPNISAFDVIQATEYIVPAIEIIDSRIEDWKLTLRDTIADNASSGLYVLGDQKISLTGIDLRQIGVSLYKNDQIENTGVGVAVLNHPAKCVAWLANKLANYHLTLEEGEVILSGALSGAIEVNPGDKVTAKFSSIGHVSVEFINDI
ncbi:2-keto-4-pentenoate hydratase [Shouchella sp. JSM 1781072]|uniref:2-keto-4-pentenoate hydratase n=1 Tax=Shouchella sp. JSM 1781072 TaxID=3344581 RepID=UPI0035C0730A